jgi:TonB family protein
MRRMILPLIVCLACGAAVEVNAAEQVAPAPGPNDYRWVSDYVVMRAADSLCLDTLGARLALSRKEAVPVDSGVDTQPEILRQAHTVYPDIARSAGLECDLWIQALIGADGQVRMARVVKTTDTTGTTDLGLERAALTAALQTAYRPAMRDGHPVQVWVTYTVKFRLR